MKVKISHICLRKNWQVLSTVYEYFSQQCNVSRNCYLQHLMMVQFQFAVSEETMMCPLCVVINYNIVTWWHLGKLKQVIIDGISQIMPY